MARLDGKVALITGAAGGMGSAQARLLAREGAAVIIADVRDELGRKLEAAITAAGGAATYRNLDVTSERAWQQTIAAVEGWRGRLDILINNAGINIRGQPQDLAPADWGKVIDTNLTSAFLCAQAAYPAMKAAGGGKIINIVSMMSIFGSSYAPAYAASKGGIVQLTKSLAVAWAADNIQVNAVLPGWIDTDLTRGARQQVPALNDNVLRRTPAKRWGEISDMSGVAVFLASAASDFVTGAAVPVDGGFSSLG